MFSPLVIALNQKAKCQTNRLPRVKASGKQIIWIKKLTKNRIKKLNAKQIEYFAWYTYLSHLASTPCMVVASTTSWAPAALASIERLSSSAPRASEPRIRLAWRRAPSDWCVHPQTTSQDKEYYDWELCVPTLCLQPPPFYSSKSGEHHFKKNQGSISSFPARRSMQVPPAAVTPHHKRLSLSRELPHPTPRTCSW